jgi:hypothetical protein
MTQGFLGDGVKLAIAGLPVKIIRSKRLFYRRNPEAKQPEGKKKHPKGKNGCLR